MEYMIHEILDIIKVHVKAFLDDADEFYPFAVAIDGNENIKSIGASLEDDHPDSEEVLTLLEKGIQKHISNGEYKVAAIALDVYIASDEERMSAVEVRIFTREGEEERLHIPYSKLDGEYVFNEII